MKNARESLMYKILHADVLVLMSESMGNLREKFLKWNEAFESKKLKINFKKINVMVSSSKEETLKSRINSQVWSEGDGKFSAVLKMW